MKNYQRCIYSWLLFAASAGLLVSCKKETGSNSAQPEVQKDISDVSYGTDPAQKMDVYLPAGRTISGTKTLILIHGGGWAEGDKSDFTDGISALRGQLADFAIFNINYRLASAGTNQYPAAINDVHSVIGFIVSHADEYIINADKIALLGASAGAHLSLLEAYKNNNERRIKAVIDLFGPTDLLWMYNEHPDTAYSHPVLFNFLGATPSADSMVYHDASPINYISAGAPATEIFHGTVDSIVPISESERLAAKLQLYHVKNEFIKYEGEGHGWVGFNLLDTYTKLVDFIKQNVQ